MSFCCLQHQQKHNYCNAPESRAGEASPRTRRRPRRRRTSARTCGTPSSSTGWSTRSSRRRGGGLGKGQMGSALMGSLQLFMFFDRGTFRVIILVNILLSPQKLQGERFSSICTVNINYFCSGPIHVDPIRLQHRAPACVHLRCCPGFSPFFTGHFFL